MDPRGCPLLVYRCLRPRHFVTIGSHFVLPPASFFFASRPCRFAPNGVFSNLSRRIWLLLFRGDFVCPNCWLASCVGIILTQVFVLFGEGGKGERRFPLSKLLASACRWFCSFCMCGGFVSFVELVGGLVGRSRNLAKKCSKVRVVN